MADEIVNKLGFDVAQALAALQQLDARLQASGTVLQAHAGQLANWNTQARAALATMKELAAAAAGVTLPTLPTAAAAAPPVAAPGLWLPPGFQTQVTQATQAMTNLGSAATATGQKVVGAATQGGAAMAGAKKHAQELSISLSMMGRIIATQMLVRALSQVRDALKDAVNAAMEFQVQIAEIVAIAPLTDTFQTLQSEAAELSRRFNIPLPQVAEGLYQTISDQFTTVAQRANIMESAMMLAKVGVMDLGDAVTLLTGTLNAYGMQSNEAATVAMKFFETIKLGHVRGKELSDVIGQVIPIAAQLGVSLDEVTSSFVSMTIGGLDAHKTATGLRQAMVAFLKPSEDMKKTLRELGYTTPEQLIQAKGWMGALQEISEASNNMASNVVKSFRNVRALTAELSLTRDGAKKYEEAMTAMSEVGVESLEKLYKQFRAIPAEKLTSEINKFKVTMTRDFGNMLVTVLGNLLQFVGGADKMAAALQALAVVGAIAGAALVALAVKALIAQAALGPVGLTILAISAAITALIGAGVYEAAMDVANVRAAAEARRVASLERIKQAEEAMRKEREARNKAREEEDKVWEEGATVLRKQYFKAVDALKEQNRTLVEDSRATMSSMISAQERVVAAYRNAAKASADAIQASRERQMATEAAYSDAVFKYARKNEDVFSKAESYMRRARQLAREAADAMREAKTPEEITAAQAIFQRADAAAQAAEQIAQGTNNIVLQEDAERIVLSVMREKIGAEQSLQSIQAAQAAKLAAQAAAEQARLNDMKVLMKAILEDLEAFDKTGAKEPKVLQEQQRRLDANMRRMRELWLAGAPRADISELLAMDKLQQRVHMAVEGGVKDIEVQQLFATPETFARFREAIERGVGPVRILLQTAVPKLSPELQKLISESTAEEALAILSSEVGKTTRVLKQYEEMGSALKTANQHLEESMGSARKGMNEWVTTQMTQDVGMVKLYAMALGGAKETKAIIQKFGAEVKRFSEVPPALLDTKDFQALNAAYQKYLETVKPSAKSKEMLDQFINDAKNAASAAEEARKLREGLREMEPKATEAARARPALQEALRQAQEAAAAAQKADVEAMKAQASAAAAKGEVSAVAAVDMSNLVAQTNAAAIAMWNLAYASMSVQTPVAPEVAARGGRVGRYLVAGGPVGTDVVPAWLSRGEFVMSAGATRQFASQLVAMNAGVRPTFRGGGGSVTNIGDISVTVQGGETGRQTARSIAAELRRELRRGTMKPL